MTGLYPTQEDLRLEVEEDLPAGALENLVANPSGDLGGWGWRTTVVGSTMIGTADTGTGPLAVPGRKLIYRSPGGVASFFTTEAFAVAPSEYVAASWIAPYVAGQYRARIEWLNAAGALISSSAQTAYATTSAATVNLASVQAPALTASARLRFDHYANTSAGNPTAGQQIALQEVTAAKSAGALGTTRTNLVPNPSFEVNTNGWGTQSALTYDRVTSPAGYSGTACLRAFPNAGATDMYIAPGIGSIGSWTSANLIPVTPAKRYVFSAYLRAQINGRTCRVGIWWYTAGGKYLGQTAGTNMVDSGTWTRNSSSGVAPASAAFARPFVWWAGVPNGEFHFMDACQFEQRTTATPTTYFDGSTAAGGGTTYAWTGTAHASTSTATTTTLDFVEPISYLDVLGPTHEIRVAREELNLGTLTATVLDAALDPSQGGIIRPGKACRLSVWDPAGGRLETLFTGEITQAAVQYHLDRQDTKRARITLEAADAGAKLAATTRKIGVAQIADLPYVLEGAGVPWNCNGNANQVPSATAVSTNDQASAMDQVAVTRDSRGGYAWVDKYGVLRAYDPDRMPSKNYLPNGDLAVDASGWGFSGASGGRLATVPKISSAPVLEAVCSGSVSSGGFFRVQFSTSPSSPGTLTGLEPGTVLAVSAELFNTTATATVTAYASLAFYDAAGVFITVSSGPTLTLPVKKWQTLTRQVTVPAGAVSASFDLILGGITAVGDRFYMRRPFVGAEAFQIVDEAGYSNLDVGFDTEQCINQVSLKYLRFKSPTTEEVPYGPYVNAESVARWGPRAAEFTVHGMAETGPTLQAFADKILAVNAEPIVRANAATVPIRTAADLPRALLDLYTLAYVRHAGLGVDNLSRVTRVEHTISPGAWLVSLGFQQTGSVAAPQVIPPVNVATSGPPHSARYISSNLAMADSAWTTVTFGTLNGPENGIGFAAGGTWTVQRAGRYLVNAAAAWPSGSPGRRLFRTLINGAEEDREESNGDDANNWTQRLTKVCRLAVGDTIQFAGYHTGGAGVVLNGALNQTHAEISWIGD